MNELLTTDWGLAYRAGSADEWILRETAYNRLLKEITPEDRVLDVGGYIGSFAARAAQRGARVLAFEPSPANYAVCQVNAVTFNYIALPFALVPYTTYSHKVVFYDAPDEHRAPYASLIPKRGYIKRSVPGMFIRNVQDEFQPTIVKLDVEGAEADLLRALKLSTLRGLAVEWELARNREQCVALDELLVQIGFTRSGKPLSRCTGRAVVKIYLRS